MTAAKDGYIPALCYNHNDWRSMSSLPNEVRLFFKTAVFEEEYYLDFPE